MSILADKPRKLQDDGRYLVPLWEGQGLPGCRYSRREKEIVASMPVNSAFSRSLSYDSAPYAPGTVSTMEYARMVGVDETTARRWCRIGKIPYIIVDQGYRKVYRVLVEPEDQS